jgi:hypothetical protein
MVVNNNYKPSIKHIYKGTNEITNKGLGFKLTNSISFGKSVISTGFNQKTIKTDLHVRVNYDRPICQS